MEDPAVIVHKRVTARHPKLSEADVRAAWRNRIRCQVRTGPWPPQYVAVGFDGKGRAVEMVAVYDPSADEVLIFHANTPVSESVRREMSPNER